MWRTKTYKRHRVSRAGSKRRSVYTPLSLQKYQLRAPLVPAGQKYTIMKVTQLIDVQINAAGDIDYTIPWNHYRTSANIASLANFFQQAKLINMKVTFTPNQAAVNILQSGQTVLNALHMVDFYAQWPSTQGNNETFYTRFANAKTFGLATGRKASISWKLDQTNYGDNTFQDLPLVPENPDYGIGGVRMFSNGISNNPPLALPGYVGQLQITDTLILIGGFSAQY